MTVNQTSSYASLAQGYHLTFTSGTWRIIDFKHQPPLLITPLWIHFIDSKRKNPPFLIPKTSIIKNYALGIGIAYATFVIIMLVYYFSGVLSIKGLRGDFFSFSINLISVWILSTFTSITEELICRGYLLNRFRERVNPHLAVLFQAIIFGLMHWNSSRGFDLVISTTLVGLTFGYLFLLTENLWSCIGMHTGIHLINVFFSQKTLSYQLKDYPYNTLFGTNLFGLGGQLIFFILLIILIVFYVRRSRLTSDNNLNKDSIA